MLIPPVRCDQNIVLLLLFYFIFKSQKFIISTERIVSKPDILIPKLLSFQVEDLTLGGTGTCFCSVFLSLQGVMESAQQDCESDYSEEEEEEEADCIENVRNTAQYFSCRSIDVWLY